MNKPRISHIIKFLKLVLKKKKKNQMKFDCKWKMEAQERNTWSNVPPPFNFLEGDSPVHVQPPPPRAGNILWATEQHSDSRVRM